MSGYLQRLAGRALGQTKPLRAMAPQHLPGENAPMQMDTPMAPSPRQVARADAMDPSRHAPHADEATRRQSGVLGDGESDRSVPPGSPTATRPVANNGTQQVDVQPRTASVPTERHAMRADADGLPSATWPQEPLPLLAAQGLHGTTQTVAQPWPAAQQADASLAGIDAAKADVPALRIPSPLLSQRHVGGLAPQVALRPRQVQPADRLPAGALEEATEVHVTIGRIEVTAVQEALAQKPAMRRRPAPVSLDEYIARRQGGRA